MSKFSTPRGTSDILPADWPYWNVVLRHAEDVARLFGYARIETPTFAETSLFARTTGQGTDIVDKEMYSFQTRGGEEVSLRPEGTAPVMRAYLQHGMHRLPQPIKLFYVERIFRYDAPQEGRYREHHQFGAEAIGVEDAYVDVEMISLLHEFYARIGLADLELRLNTIGDQECRPRYVQALVAHLRGHEENLAATDGARLERNPLRVLDSKEPASQEAITSAPSMIDFLCDDCRAHWEKLQRGLGILGISYSVDHRLVRGLDYYTRTVFEFLPPVEGAQAVVGGGGRYDALSEAMGGPHVPGVGFGTGIERLILNMKRQGIALEPEPAAEVYVAHVGEGTEDAALCIARDLRRANVPAVMSFGDRGLKGQLRAAAGSGAEYAAITFENEMREGTVVLRRLDSGEQETVPVDRLNDTVSGRHRH